MFQMANALLGKQEVTSQIHATGYSNVTVTRLLISQLND